jgi:hypothetical protein
MRNESMDWSSKRDGGTLSADKRSVLTIAKRGSPKLITHPYDKMIGKVGLSESEFKRYDARLMADEQPDWIGELE